jgi:hypothetical protein
MLLVVLILEKSGIFLGLSCLDFLLLYLLSLPFDNNSPEQLKDLGIEWVILGHSERREILKESDEVC